jgi:tRNA(Arg) A34 adenosine deaminase TadA
MDKDKLRELLGETIHMASANISGGEGGPFAALIIREGEVIARGVNRVMGTNDPTAHAEVVAIRDACKTLGTYDLSGCTIISSCEPCPMCLSAIYWAHLDKVYYAAGKDDAARAGFDDAFLYEEMKLEPEARKLIAIKIEIPKSDKPFKDWLSLENRVAY